MPVRMPVNISSNTIYRNVNDADDQFDIFADATLVLRANDILTDDAITGAGLLRVSGSTTIDNSLTLDDTATLAKRKAGHRNASFRRRDRAQRQ